MKVWFAADIPGVQSGGIACSMRELSHGLSARGHTVQILTREDLPCSNYLVFAFKLCIRFLFSGDDRPDWIIARSTDAIFCNIIIKLFRLPTGTIVHNHGWEEIVYEVENRLPASIVTNPTTWRARLVRFPLLRIMLHVCSYCLSGTEYENRIIGERYPRLRHKLKYLPNGTGVVPQTKTERKEYPLRFITVGNATWKKNLQHSVSIFSHLQEWFTDANLLCVGTGLDDRDFNNYCGVKTGGITNVPEVGYEQMEGLYERHPFMIASSRYEGGHSFAILEALSFGIIVFASDIFSNREIIRDRINGYVINGKNSIEDAKTIIEVIKEGTAGEKVRKNAVRTAERHSWENQVMKLERLLCGIQ